MSVYIAATLTAARGKPPVSSSHLRMNGGLRFRTHAMRSPPDDQRAGPVDKRGADAGRRLFRPGDWPRLPGPCEEAGARDSRNGLAEGPVLVGELELARFLAKTAADGSASSHGEASRERRDDQGKAPSMGIATVTRNHESMLGETAEPEEKPNKKKKNLHEEWADGRDGTNSGAVQSGLRVSAGHSASGRWRPWETSEVQNVPVPSRPSPSRMYGRAEAVRRTKVRECEGELDF